ncbi:MAG: DUF4004 family protein [Sarcina sp.]
MEEKLISKKDLLDYTGISYGQLYRWKRKKIIPEEWFIKKSVSTGQETFFPMEQILERINMILALKDEKSLDELANKFSTNVENIEISRNYIMGRNLISQFVLEKYEEFYEKKEKYTTEEMILLLLFEELINTAALSFLEIKEITDAIEKVLSNIKNEDMLIVERKLGVLFYYLTNKDMEVLEDNLAKIILKINFADFKKIIKELME